MAYKDPARRNELAKAWREANPEKVIAARRLWRKNNNDKTIAQRNAWRKANPVVWEKCRLRAELKSTFGLPPPEELVEVLTLQRLIKREIKRASK